MRRPSSLVIVAVFVLSTAAVPVNGAASDVVIQDVTTSVDQPAPGENLTVMVDVANPPE